MLLIGGLILRLFEVRLQRRYDACKIIESNFESGREGAQEVAIFSRRHPSLLEKLPLFFVDSDGGGCTSAAQGQLDPATPDRSSKVEDGDGQKSWAWICEECVHVVLPSFSPMKRAARDEQLYGGDGYWLWPG
jgi:hypothetical protein